METLRRAPTFSSGLLGTDMIRRPFLGQVHVLIQGHVCYTMHLFGLRSFTSVKLPVSVSWQACEVLNSFGIMTFSYGGHSVLPDVKAHRRSDVHPLARPPWVKAKKRSVPCRGPWDGPTRLGRSVVCDAGP